jgi:hypothetical protein
MVTTEEETMIELRNNCLNFGFPGVHDEASCSIDFQRTLRIPDDNKPYALPPGLGRFPVKHIDDYAPKLPEDWVTHGGVFIPMYQSEALWINFHGSYPCAVKIAAGKINAVDGSSWSKQLSKREQDYVVIPEQPWLDGFNVTEDFIRQFVAMPLGEGYTAEEQVTGTAEHGGLQIIVYPMKRERYVQLLTKSSEGPDFRNSDDYLDMDSFASLSMGLAPGGIMRQEINDDSHGVDVWDQENGLRCFVHLVNSAVYTEITGTAPPHKPPTAKEYTAAGLPWFKFYSDAATIGGSKALGGLTSIGAKIVQKTGQPLQNNESVTPVKVKPIGNSNTVRQGHF